MFLIFSPVNVREAKDSAKASRLHVPAEAGRSPEAAILLPCLPQPRPTQLSGP